MFRCALIKEIPSVKKKVAYVISINHVIGEKKSRESDVTHRKFTESSRTCSMATIETIEKQLEEAKKKLEKAEEKLEEWEEGEDDGKWLKELRRKTRRNDLSEKEEREKARLEKKEEGLEKDKNDKWEQVKKFQNALLEFGKEKGNEQIA